MTLVAVDSNLVDAPLVANCLREWGFEAEIRPIYQGGNLEREMDGNTIYLMVVTTANLPKFSFLVRQRTVHALIFGESLKDSIKSVSQGRAFSLDLDLIRDDYSQLRLKLQGAEETSLFANQAVQ